MSLPPQGGWQNPQQPGPPPNQGQPQGQQFNPSGYPPPPPGWQQGNWPEQPGPPQQNRNSLKWLLIAVAVLLVIGISVGATLIFTRGGGGGDAETTPTSGSQSDIASANDTGPVSIITEEPTCSSFIGVNNSLADLESQGWGAQRKTLGPVSEWSPDQRAQVEAVATAMRKAADQSVPFLKLTPHRVVRELYSQFIAYGRAYADSIENYVPSDDGLASANVNASSAIIGICNTITYGSANRGLGSGSAPSPTAVGDLGPPNDPQRFVTASDATCSEWVARLDKLNADTAEWANVDPSVPALNWPSERQALEQSVHPLIAAYADATETAGLHSGNPILEDFALSSALYLRAYLSVGNTYTGADGWLSYVGFRFANLVSGACRAAAG